MRLYRLITDYSLFRASYCLTQTDANFCRLYEDVGLSLGEIFARLRYVCEHAVLLLIFHLRAYRLIDLSHEVDPRALQSAFASQSQQQPQQLYASASKQASQRQSAAAAAAAAANAVSECRVGDGWLSDASVRRISECRKDLHAFAQIKFQHVACAALLRLVALLETDMGALAQPSSTSSRK